MAAWPIAILRENSHANYLFRKEGQGYQGVRLFLSKIDESTDHELLTSMSRHHLTAEKDAAKGKKIVVRFTVNQVLPLIGGEEIMIE